MLNRLLRLVPLLAVSDLFCALRPLQIGHKAVLWWECKRRDISAFLRTNSRGKKSPLRLIMKSAQSLLPTMLHQILLWRLQSGKKANLYLHFFALMCLHSLYQETWRGTISCLAKVRAKFWPSSTHSFFYVCALCVVGTQVLAFITTALSYCPSRLC